MEMLEVVSETFAPRYYLPQSQTMQSGGLTVELTTKKDVRLEYNLSLDDFNRAFRKYRNSVKLAELE